MGLYKMIFYAVLSKFSFGKWNHITPDEKWLGMWLLFQVAHCRSKVPNRYTIQIFWEQCLNGATQRTIEMSLNGLTVKLRENRIPGILQKWKQLHTKQVLGKWMDFVPRGYNFCDFNINASIWEMVNKFS